MKISRIIPVIIISIALLATSIGAALADDPEVTPSATTVATPAAAGVKYQGLVGTIESISWNSDTPPVIAAITLDTTARGELEVAVNSDTIYKIPGQTEATQAEVITEGKRVAILATEEEGIYTATRVMLISEKANRCQVQHINGVVMSVENGVMTITTDDGETITIDMPNGLKGAVVGNMICAAVRQCEKEKICTGIQTMDQVRERLQTHLADVVSNRVENKIEKNKNIENLNRWLERLQERNQEMLNTALENTNNEQVRAVIQNAIQNANQNMNQNSAGGQPTSNQNSGGGKNH
ncbi:MAG: hypothetical protein PHV74_02755 [Dehalococcoidia bacterium]|nr:hypothetical protein [Dehalococcoidia bacterium]